ncbi:MAG: acetyl-CoA carboxylase biotin carboxylase subunit [Bacillati bacterium ANGP1]|uniref:Biotin carboxylase n=1 Tax=Candidatus Segetimicrobium genomatis TaxID=2569760 RepID=A0A537JBM8_9BACT|nr:MAG: acetyl-CoA carboxylase biotin carboxylase subunit [Terrabacteria group bacterium ANGP1]
MFSKVLIANRGEIAVRIIRACRELGLSTVAVYSEADRGSLHVRLADEAFCIGPAPARDSYLNIPSIISTAELLGVDAIHPGYGFLAENPHFAEVCRDCGISFIGPSPEAIQKMGNKSTAREMVRKAGVAIVPGSDGPVRDEAAAAGIARNLGYPLIIKAAGGGGGRGMRVVHNRDDLRRAMTEARAEAEAAFGNGEVYVEKYLEEPRHVEVQILADARGTVATLGERDCSVQRRHQKLIEESPSLGVGPKLRRALSRAAARVAEAAGYTNAGTVEFLVDHAERFYFVEMNTRIQVEHGVTEMVTGIDIVKEQIRIAAGERLAVPREMEPRGHAIECRVNAEDPARDFLPSPGTIVAFVPPGGPGIRVDTHVFAGYTVPPHYDSLIAKVIAWGQDREEAIARMQRALREFEIAGIQTTIPFHQDALENAFFRRGEVYVNFVQRRMDLTVLHV